MHRPCGKKNPEIQNDFGTPFSIQYCIIDHQYCVNIVNQLTSIKCNLRTKSLTQEPSGFKDGYAALAQS